MRSPSGWTRHGGASPPRSARNRAARSRAALESDPSVVTHTYSMIGLQAGTDLLIWRLAPSLDALEMSAAAAPCERGWAAG